MSALWLISGPSGAGKTSVSSALCRRYPRAIHIPIDDLRHFVESGIASPVDAHADRQEVVKQFALARRAGLWMAEQYRAAGFAVVIDDAVGGLVRELYVPLIRGGARCISLMPSLVAALERNRTRKNKTFDTSVLDPVTRDLHEYMTRENTEAAGWVIVDSTGLTIEETVDAIVARCGL